MSDDESPQSQFGFVPKLTRLNYEDWVLQIEAYLTSLGHWYVLEEEEDETTGVITIPTAPTNKTSTDGKRWAKAERSASAVLMATACGRHAELVQKHRKQPYKLWKAIEAQNRQQDASLRHKAWIQFLAVHKKADETFVDYYRQAEAAKAKITRITPKSQTPDV